MVIEQEEEGQIQIEKVKIPDNWKFDERELAEAFMLVSEPTESEAKELRRTYLSQKIDDGKCVYNTWREGMDPQLWKKDSEGATVPRDLKDKSEVLLKSTYDYSRKEKKIGGYKDPTELDRLRRFEIRKLGAWRKLMDVLDFVSDYGQKELLDAFERNLGSDPAKSGFDGELAEIIIRELAARRQRDKQPGRLPNLFSNLASELSQLGRVANHIKEIKKEHLRFRGCSLDNSELEPFVTNETMDRLLVYGWIRHPSNRSEFELALNVLNGIEAAVKDGTSEAKVLETMAQFQIKKNDVDLVKSVFGKYKPVALKVKPVKAPLPEEFRIEQNIQGDPLAGLPNLPTNPPEYEPVGRYTEERKMIIDKNHSEDFLWDEERNLMHYLMMVHEDAFAWSPEEGGLFRTDFFPLVKIPVLPHTPWVERNIPIPPGIFEQVCNIIKDKIDAGVYEPSSSSYRSKWFCVLKKDGKSLRLVHSLEPLNAVTIQHSGIPPATAEVAAGFAGRACVGLLDIYVGYDERLISEESRDLTTFQTPFGPHRLVKLPMGWTNSVPIFHDDVTHILRDEIPHVTRPYVDDVPIKGPPTRYEIPGKPGMYETIPENPGIRKFVWEHMQHVNRICQRMKYCGVTFSGPKAYLCLSEGEVLGHKVSYEGEKPVERFANTILSWDPHKFRDKTDIKSFLGTAVQLRQFIKDYARITRPLNRLTSKSVVFEMGNEQFEAVELLKEAVRNAPALKPIDVHNPNGLVLSVDTSWQAVGFILYQVDAENPKKKYFNWFGSIPLNEREARFSQPKRELFGLKLALQATFYQTYGCRPLIVETDASYIKGMLDNPSCGPNATINRWIEEIRKYKFELVHVKGEIHGPDGLSRPPPGGLETQRGAEEEDAEWDEDDGEPITFRMGDEETYPPLEFDTFKEDIDTRGGYFTQLAASEEDFHEELRTAEEEATVWSFQVQDHMSQFGPEVLTCFTNTWVVPPNPDPEWMKENPYSEEHRTEYAKKYDRELERIQKYLEDPVKSDLPMPKSQKQKFISKCSQYGIFGGQLYKLDLDGNKQHPLVMDKDKRMWILAAV